MRIILDNRSGQAPQLEAARTALLAIHWQNDVLNPEGAFGPAFAGRAAATGLVDRQAALMQQARQAGARIIYCNVAYAPGHPEVVHNSALFVTAARRNAFVRGSAGARVVDALQPQPGDFVIEHSRISCFFGTDLQIILRAADIDTLLVTGIATNVAVDHTVRDAVQLGYRTVLVEDCCCSSDDAYHDAAMLSLRALSTHVVPAASLKEMLT